MAEIFTASLLSRVPVSTLDDPHTEVPVSPGTTVSLHEVLCQMRSLSWCDAGTPLAEAAPAYGLAAHQRRKLRWNGDRQLTLGTLFRGGVQLPCGQASRLSRLFETDARRGDAFGPIDGPGEAAPLSEWLRWSAEHSGAGLELPGRAEQIADLQTHQDMAQHCLGAPAGRLFYNTALAALSNDAPLDPGLPETSETNALWTGGRLLALLEEVERRARFAALDQLSAKDRLSRPAVTAARMTVYLAREERHETPEDDTYRHAADELSLAAPDLLFWVSRANAFGRGRVRFERSLFLPVGAANAPFHPVDAATHMVVAGAMATVLKAVLDTSSPARLRLGRPASDAVDLALELDKAVSNIAMARTLNGYYPSENHQDMRVGQNIALQVLRDALERDNVDASLALRDFDGRALRLQAQARPLGRGAAKLQVESEWMGWPRGTARQDTHLTAVV